MQAHSSSMFICKQASGCFFGVGDRSELLSHAHRSKPTHFLCEHAHSLTAPQVRVEMLFTLSYAERKNSKWTRSLFASTGERSTRKVRAQGIEVNKK